MFFWGDITSPPAPLLEKRRGGRKRNTREACLHLFFRSIKGVFLTLPRFENSISTFYRAESTNYGTENENYGTQRTNYLTERENYGRENENYGTENVLHPIKSTYGAVIR